jgi:hypothetical protein
MKNQPISRREVLKGVGVAMCLPLMEAMEPLKAFASGQDSAVAGKAPLRFAAMYMPNGVNPHQWTPTGAGADFTLAPIMKPLENLKSEILVLTNLANKHSFTGDGHYYKVAPFLTGTEIQKTTGADVRCGATSLDQRIAQHIGSFTPLPSLELSVEAPWTFVDTNVGLTTLYGGHISWSTPTTPVSREVNPQLAFDRLFRRHAPGKGTDPKEASVLDAVKEDAQRLKKRISLADRLKLEEYFDSVRAVEKRIAFDAARRKHDLMDDPACRAEIDKLGQRIKTYYDVPEGKRSIDHTEQVRLMMDLMALAFWTDATRVATFMFGVEVSGKNFSFIPGVSGSFHEISHHQNDKAKLEEYAKINAWHMEQYAYFLNRLRSFKEGDSDVLTNSITLCGAGIRDGNAHDPHNIPVILAGRGGGTIATGRHLVYEPNTAFCDVHLGIAHRMGLSLKEFGDSTQELKGLTDPTFKGTVKA